MVRYFKMSELIGEVISDVSDVILEGCEQPKHNFLSEKPKLHQICQGTWE